MRKLSPIKFSARDIVVLCASSIRDNDLKRRVGDLADAVETAEEVYLNSADRYAFFDIPKSDCVGQVTVDEMKRVYKGTFAKSKTTRPIYDLIKKLPENDICPMCGQRTVGTLDHYLAQSLHPALVVTPANLLPSCGDCNKAKLDAQPQSEVEQTLHPYFDEVDDADWLFADVQMTSPAALRFQVRGPANWPQIKVERVQLHFKTFGLGALYASHSAVEIANMRYALGKILERGTAAQVQSELLLRFESCAEASRNSWQTAMYRALASSDWFYSGGFR
ncbi:hypothetical protein NAC44_03660 [Allorhizobium sp. BGMRC 0089]|uniref:hypothetical protein n=1 Tax=Allorhizobium sonneratiae TaxID=2934936 RepID=UPI002034027A|nr:hypothetical protein [Allorhizobium sonneratiae]MCM2291424.1 hypothetical protein [Allorhizobium sonneratiae]